MAQAPQPFFDTAWVVRHVAEIGERLAQHVQLTLLAVAVGVAISLPTGVFAYRHRRTYAPIASFAGVVYTIPSLALFAFLTAYTGLTTLTAEIGLVGYTLLILIRNVVAGLDGVPKDAKDAALGMGYTPRQLLFRVELPLALPVITAGVRVATVTTIGLVTVTAVIGKGGLGYFMLLGLRRFFSTPIVVGAGLSVVFALLADVFLARTQSMVAPWLGSRRPARQALRG